MQIDEAATAKGTLITFNGSHVDRDPFGWPPGCAADVVMPWVAQATAENPFHTHAELSIELPLFPVLTPNGVKSVVGWTSWLPQLWKIRPRRVLVLEGGGAKGAYAFGWLKRIKERGVKFDAVCGTSVGALNGLLWCTDALEMGERYWRELIPAKVHTPALPRFLRLPIVVFHAFLRACQHRYQTKHWGPLGLLAFLANYSWWMVTASPIFYVLSKLLGRDEGTVWDWIRKGLWGLIPPFIFFGIPWLLKTAGVRAFRPEGLKEIVRSVVAPPARLRVPLYATTASREAVPHPDHLVPPDDEFSWFTVPVFFVPRYVRLTRFSSRQEIAEATLASANLPYSIFSADTHEVDGGVVDNLPVVPALLYERAEQVVIVRVNPPWVPLDKTPLGSVRHPDTGEGYWSYACEFDELIRASKIDTTGGELLTPDSLRDQLPPSNLKRPKTVIVLRPTREVGSMLDVLNFDRAYTCPLVDEGYRDAMNMDEVNWVFLGADSIIGPTENNGAR